GGGRGGAARWSLCRRRGRARHYARYLAPPGPLRAPPAALRDRNRRCRRLSPAPGDHRAVPRGEQPLADLDRSLLRVEDQILAPLTGTEQQTLHALLGKAVKHIGPECTPLPGQGC